MAVVLEHARECVAVRGMTAARSDERARRIRRDELDHHPLAVVRSTAAEGLAGVEHAGDDGLPRRGGEPEVDESGAGDVDG